MPILRFSFSFMIICASFFGAARAQSVPQQTLPQQQPAAPATKIEAFKPEAGSVVTFGYDDIGELKGISVDARELRNQRGSVVRGLLVEITQDQYRQERSFVDADEIPELLKGFDALLGVKTNPTQFQNFEVRYTTRGDLKLTAFNDSAAGLIKYAVEVGRTVKASRIGLNTTEMERLRARFMAASQKLQSVAR